MPATRKKFTVNREKNWLPALKSCRGNPRICWRTQKETNLNQNSQGRLSTRQKRSSLSIVNLPQDSFLPTKPKAHSCKCRRRSLWMVWVEDYWDIFKIGQMSVRIKIIWFSIELVLEDFLPLVDELLLWVDDKERERGEQSIWKYEKLRCLLLKIRENSWCNKNLPENFVKILPCFEV